MVSQKAINGWLALTAAAASFHFAATDGGKAQAAAWETPTVALGLAFDSNVYQVDEGILRRRESFVATVSPQLAYKPFDGVRLAYDGRGQRFFSESSEDNYRQTLGLRFARDLGDWTVRVNTAQTRVHGEARAVDFDAGRNAFTTAVMRERRNQWQNRSDYTLRRGFGDTFIRSRGRLLYFDLDTDRLVGAERPAGYDNYINRYDINAGLEVGTSATPVGEVYLGFRHGYTHQGVQGGRTAHRSSHYERFVLGWDGKLHPRLTGNAELGVARHRYAFGPGALSLTRPYYAVNLAWRSTEHDTVRLRLAEWQWVSSTGGLSNRDFTYRLGWTRTGLGEWTTEASLLARGATYDGNVTNDWVYTLGLNASRPLGEVWRMALNAELNRGRDENIGRAGRNFERGFFGVTVTRTLDGLLPK